MKHKLFNISLEKVPYLLFLLITVLFCTNPFSLLDFPLDDAWIHRVYSKSFAFGHGFEYNAGQQEAGSTSPLWSIVTAPAHWLEFLGTTTVVLATKLIGILLALSSIHAVRKLGEVVGLERASLFAAIAFALDPKLVFSALSGMESVLLVSLWLWAAYALLRNNWWLACGLISLTPTVRPEALVILPIFTFAFILFATHTKLNRSSFASILILPTPMLIWSLFCKQANGHWLPTTYYIKKGGFEFGSLQVEQVWEALGYRGLFPSAIMAALIIFYFLQAGITKRKWVSSLLLIAAPTAFIGGVVCGRVFQFDGYYFTRWIEPPVLVLASASAMGMATLIKESVHSSSKGSAAAMIRAITLSLVLASVHHGTTSFIEQRHHLAQDSRVINLVNVQAGQWINENLPKEATVAINDAGALKYFGQRKTIDIIGLNNAEITFHGNREQAILSTDFVVIFPSWFRNYPIFQHLDPIQEFSVPPEEYTLISSAKNINNRKVVYRNSLKADQTESPGNNLERAH
jgi:hypothetical protein